MNPPPRGGGGVTAVLHTHPVVVDERSTWVPDLDPEPYGWRWPLRTGAAGGCPSTPARPAPPSVGFSAPALVTLGQVPLRPSEKMQHPHSIDMGTAHSITIPGHDESERPPFEVNNVDGRLYATLASGGELDLTNLIPALACLMIESRDVTKCWNASLAGLGFPLTFTEEVFLIDCVMGVIQTELKQDSPVGPAQG